MPFPNLSFFYLDDFVAAGKRVENCFGKSAENLIENFVGNWLMILSCELVRKVLS